ncbi:MAG: RHS repeat-associated core domain-containing protein [bacterium]
MLKKLVNLLAFSFFILLLPSTALSNVSHTIYSYDRNGNTLQQESRQSTKISRTSFSYNSSNRLIKSNSEKEFTGLYSYRYDGMRTKKINTKDRKIKKYVYDDKAVLLEKNENNLVSAKYTYGRRLLKLEDKGNNRIQYYHYDSLGSVSDLSENGGSTVASLVYDPWGNFRNNLDKNSTVSRFTFTGKEFDEENGLLYFGARYYDGEQGRFITQDTYLGELSESPSLHRYLYCYGNPGRYTDSYGYNNIEVLNETMNQLPYYAPQSLQFYQTTQNLFSNIDPATWYSSMSFAVTPITYYTSSTLSAASAISSGTTLGTGTSVSLGVAAPLAVASIGTGCLIGYVATEYTPLGDYLGKFGIWLYDITHPQVCPPKEVVPPLRDPAPSYQVYEPGYNNPILLPGRDIGNYKICPSTNNPVSNYLFSNSFDDFHREIDRLTLENVFREIKNNPDKYGITFGWGDHRIFVYKIINSTNGRRESILELPYDDFTDLSESIISKNTTDSNLVEGYIEVFNRISTRLKTKAKNIIEEYKGHNCNNPLVDGFDSEREEQLTINKTTFEAANNKINQFRNQIPLN